MLRLRVLAFDCARVIATTVALLRLSVRMLRQRATEGHWDGRFVGAHLRATLQSLGMTYVKLGQFLAARFDLLPIATCDELARLFDQTEPFPDNDVRRIVETDLGGPIAQLFRDFDSTPIAAASIAQVHRATTLRGHRVAVKVQRPDIVRYFRADIRWFRLLARVGDWFRLFGGLYATEAVEEFAAYTWRELDFRLEGKTADRLRANAGRHEVFPRIWWTLSSERVLTMDFVEGVSFGRIIELADRRELSRIAKTIPEYDLKLALRRFTHATLRQLFIDGLFHGDPHPGNVLLCHGNRIGFVDFGIFGELGERDRKILATYIQRNVAGDVAGSFRAFSKLCSPTRQTDLVTFERESKLILRRWARALNNPALTGKDKLIGKYANEMFSLIRKQNVRMSMDTLLFWRTIITLDAAAQRLSDHFDVGVELRRFFATYGPDPFELIFQRGIARQQMLFAAKAVERGPRSAAIAIERATEGAIQLQIAEEESQAFARDARAATRQLTAAASLVLFVALIPSGIREVVAQAPSASGFRFGSIHVIALTMLCWLGVRRITRR